MIDIIRWGVIPIFLFLCVFLIYKLRKNHALIRNRDLVYCEDVKKIRTIKIFYGITATLVFSFFMLFFVIVLMFKTSPELYLFNIRPLTISAETVPAEPDSNSLVLVKKINNVSDMVPRDIVCLKVTDYFVARELASNDPSGAIEVMDINNPLLPPESAHFDDVYGSVIQDISWVKPMANDFNSMFWGTLIWIILPLFILLTLLFVSRNTMLRNLIRQNREEDSDFSYEKNADLPYYPVYDANPYHAKNDYSQNYQNVPRDYDIYQERSYGSDSYQRHNFEPDPYIDFDPQFDSFNENYLDLNAQDDLVFDSDDNYEYSSYDESEKDLDTDWSPEWDSELYEDSYDESNDKFRDYD